MIERVTLLWKRFSPLEERLLAEVRHVLPAAAQPSFDAQAAAINRVQRSPPSWTEICFYRMRRGRANWSGVPLFPCTDEFRLADVRFQIGGQRFKSTLTSVGGHIFDFATTPGPKHVSFAAWDAEPRVTLLADPLRATTGTKETESLPAAWTALLQSRVGAPWGDWQLHDAATAYRLTLNDGEYLVLAEREGDEFILHRIEPQAEALFHLPHHDGVPEPVVGELDALMRRDARQGDGVDKRRPG